MPGDDPRRQWLQEASEAAGPEAVEQLTRMLVHELANPLTVILTAFEAMETGELDAALVRNLAVRGRRQAEHIGELLRDLREGGAAHSASAADTRRQNVSLGALVRDTCEAIGPAGAGRITNAVPDDLMVWTVPSRLRLVLTNLLANAAKHATADLIRVEARVEETSFTVDVLDRSAPGSMGLGLHVVRELAASLGGTVTLLSRPGGGTVARVVLAQRRAG